MKRLAPSALALALALTPFCATAQETPAIADSVTSAETGFTVNGAAITETLTGYVEEGRIAGANVLVWQGDEEVYFESFGMADIEAGRPMSRDTLFQIYSMTKPITGVALMTLYEDGRFELDDPLSDYLPAFADMQVYAGLDEDGLPAFEPASRAITVKDIMQHTGGLGYGMDGSPVAGFYVDAGIMDREDTLEQMVSKLAGLPLYTQPGIQWNYSVSVSVQARLVEVLSGMGYDDYLQQEIFTPLGMDEAMRFVPEDKRGRMAGFYTDETGSLAPVPAEIAFNDNFNDWPLELGGQGLVMTIDDYGQFARMLLDQGSLGGTTILEPETVQLMATDHLPDTVTDLTWLPGKGEVGFGLDFAVRTKAPDDPEEASGAVGEFFWDGYASTLFWVDPQNDLTVVMMVQKVPFDEIGLHKALRDAVYKGSPYAAPIENQPQETAQ